MKRLCTLLALGATAALAVSACGSTAPPPGATGTSSSSAPTSGRNGTSAAPSGEPGQWAPRESATITPGIEAYTGNDQCTTNFVFTDDAHNVYIGQASHCASKGTGRDTNGCKTESQPIGTQVTFNKPGNPKKRGAEIGKGTLAYSSWIAMQSDGEKDSNTCAYNDFALVKVDAADVGKVNPTVPQWGGPVGLNTTGTTDGETLYSYGNSSLRFGIKLFSKQIGKAKPTDPAVDGWSHALTSEKHDPGIPGDSGAAYLDHAGNALGTLSTLGISIPVVNTIGDLSHELSYAQAHSKIAGLQLVMGTVGFTGK